MKADLRRLFVVTVTAMAVSATLPVVTAGDPDDCDPDDFVCQVEDLIPDGLTVCVGIWGWESKVNGNDPIATAEGEQEDYQGVLLANGGSASGGYSYAFIGATSNMDDCDGSNANVESAAAADLVFFWGLGLPHIIQDVVTQIIDR